MQKRLTSSSAFWLLLALSPLAATAQTAPATPAPETATLPAVTVPAAAPAGDAQPVTATAGPRTSLGDTKISVFFTPLQMQAVTEALTDYESHAATGISSGKTDLDVDLSKLEDAPQITEPAVYPVFYLSSIAYKSPSDWSLWVSGHKITSHKNNTDLQVLSVTANQATFAWKPVYTDAIATRQRANMFAPTDAVKNKLTKTPGNTYDPVAGVMRFTLRTNQSFLPAYMNTFEGFLTSPALPPMKAEGEITAATPANPSPVAGNAGVSVPLAQQSPKDVVQGLSVSASRAEIDAQLRRAKESKAP